MPNWADVLKTDLLDRLGEECTTTRELAIKVGAALKEAITVDSLFNAHKRHKDNLGLKPSLMDYMGTVEKDPPLKLEHIKWILSKEKRAEFRAAKRYIFTSSMNDCGLDTNFWASIQNYVAHTGACLIVVPSRYKNPSSREETDKQNSESVWPQEVHEHMTDEMLRLNKNLMLLANVRVSATAVNPLTGLEALSRGTSAIFGHSQISIKMVPTPQHHIPKVLYTTGSCSKPRYSDTRAGIRGEFNHSLGALVVELDGAKFYARTVAADNDGGFYDLNHYYGPSGVEKSSNVLAIVTGDEHAMFNDKTNRAATYLNKDSIVQTLRPEKIVRHDVFDGYSISHHNRKDPVIQYSKHKHGHHKVLDELELTAKHIEETTPDFAENVIVASNHHDHLLRWLKETHPIQEPWNIDAWLELWTLLKDTVEFRDTGVVHSDPLALWMKSRLKAPTKFLPRDSEYAIGDVLVGFHGDQGINGSRGSLNQYARLGAKTVIGHSHTPGIKQGAFQVGTSSTLRMDYTKGPSTWAHCHAIIYPNGKRQLIFVVDGKWKADV